MSYKNTTCLPLARALLETEGGWLLDLGDGHYLVTDDRGTVRALRDEAFAVQCESLQQWDETLLPMKD